MVQPARMIRMKVRKHNRANLLRLNSDLPQLRTDLLLGCYIHAHSKAVVGVPPWKVAGFGRSGCFPGIHYDCALWVFDSPRMNREPLCP